MRVLSGYSLVGQLTGLIKEKGSVDIGHHLLAVNAKNPLVSSTPFGDCLARLVAGNTTTKQSRSKPHNGKSKKHVDKASHF